MGRAVEQIALRRGHEIAAIIDADNLQDFESEAFASADVAIEFTNASQAAANFKKAWAKGMPVVSGTTGRLADVSIQTLCSQYGDGRNTLLHSSNFSVGVNILFALNRQIARIMAGFPEYKVSIGETHHIHKLDHPSGTAITLADGIIEGNGSYDTWLEPTDVVSDGAIPVTCTREGENPGFHEVKWTSPCDSITISHQAYSREGFALGAVLAAEWLVKQPKGKLYSIDDMFNFINVK